jgi:hypothetical protein
MDAWMHGCMDVWSDWNDGMAPPGKITNYKIQITNKEVSVSHRQILNACGG